MPEISKDELFEGIRSCLERLRSYQEDVVTAATDPITPKVVWKVQNYRQGLLYRAVALGDGLFSSLEKQNALSAVVLARSILETAAMAWHFSSSAEKHVESEDFNAVDDLVMLHTFSTRSRDFDADKYGARNILTLIEIMGRELLGDKKEKRTRKLYEGLSEFAHPNWSGTVGLFGELDEERFEYRFSEAMPWTKNIDAPIIAGAHALALIEISLDRVEPMIPRIWELSERDRLASETP